VSSVDEDTDPSEAEIVAVPTPTLVASPWLPVELLIVATACISELQVTEFVSVCVLPSVYVPVAVNC
jgi:hypothetical protein